ncbi:MAG: HEPN domain-containing protein [bacterium]
MIILFNNKRYSDCLFFGHNVLEKILKGFVVKDTKKQAPHTHDLIRLSELIKLNLDKDEILLLNRINSFNIRTRYPGYKLNFYKLCTKKYTESYLNGIKKIYKKLCQKLKSEK